MMPTETNTKRKLTTPQAIIVTGFMMAIAVFFGLRAQAPAGQQAPEVNLEAVRPLDATDHVRGTADAKVVIYEYSDFECPFCKKFHETLKQVVQEYDGELAWVYRHFPLESLHPRAFALAVGAECAGAQGGEESFWKYADIILATALDQSFDPALLPDVARSIGLDTAAFSSCIDSDVHNARVMADAENAMATGGQGTPWSIIVGASGKKYQVNGAMSLQAIKQVIDLAIKEA